MKMAVSRIVADLNDLRGVWEVFKGFFVATEKELFASQGGTGGAGRWPALSPGYAAWKAKHYPGAGILVRSGALRGEMTTPAIYQAQPRSLVIGGGVDASYGIYHQTGDGVPVRKVIDIATMQEVALGKALQYEAKRLEMLWQGSYAGSAVASAKGLDASFAKAVG